NAHAAVEAGDSWKRIFYRPAAVFWVTAGDFWVTLCQFRLPTNLRAMTYSSSFRLTILAFSMLGSAFSQPAASYISRTVAGVFPIGDNGPATSALLESPQAVAADASGNLFIADSGNGAIRKVARNGVITSLVGYS